MRVVGVYGASGCGRGLMPILRDRLAGENTTLVFIDDDPAMPRIMNGHPVMSWENFVSQRTDDSTVCLAVANSRMREKLAQRCDAHGIPLAEARAASVVVFDDVHLGDGACLSPFVTLTSNIRIGRCFHANLYSYVEHDCVIGDFVTFAPGVKCNGNVVIGSHAYIGTGAMIRQGTPERPLRIGAGAVIGMGAVVTRDVPPGVTVVGNPARLFSEG